MQDQNKTDYEKELSDAVQYAVRSGDFSQLKGAISGSMQGILNKTMGEVQKSVSNAAKEIDKAGSQLSGKRQTVQVKNVGYGSSASRTGRVTALAKRTPVQPSGGSVAIFVLGIVGTTFTAPGVIAGFALTLARGRAGDTVLFGVFALLMAAFILMIVKGSQGMQFAARYKKYWRLLAEKGFCTVTGLAGEVRKGKEFVLKDLSRMLRKGWFPEGHLDEKKTCLIYGQELYQQYLATQEQQKRLLLEQEKRRQDETGLYAVMDAGKEWISQIRLANDKLPGEVISNKLYQLEEVTTRIFAYVEQRPAKLPEIRRFMEYYLPTTMKLVNAYCEFESQPVQLESVQQTKREIEESLDTINQAFVALLDNLYQDDAIDISTDISALKAMLAQEGLSQDEFGVS